MINLKNRNIILSITAVLLFIAGLMSNDPFGWFEYSYAKAEKLLEIKNSENIKKVTVNKGSEELLEFERRSDGWYVSEKGETYRADSKKVKENLEKVLDIKRYRVVTSDKEKFSEYGVDKESLSLTISTENGKDRIFIGVPGSTFNTTLVRLEGEEEVYSARGTLLDDFNRGADLYRDKKLLQFVPANVTGITLKGPENYSLTRDTTGIWTFNNESPAAEDEVNRLLTELSSLEGSGFVEKPSARDYGTIALTFSNNMTKEIQVKGSGDDSDYYVRSTDNDAWMSIARYKIQSLFIAQSTITSKSAGQPVKN